MVAEDVPIKDDDVHTSDESKKKTKKKSRKSKSSSDKKKKSRKSSSKAKKKAVRYNPLEHVLVPKHEIVSDEEKEKLKEIYGDLELFPKIFANDPVVVRLGAKPGDLIKITRPGDTHPYYRLVIVREV